MGLGIQQKCMRLASNGLSGSSLVHVHVQSMNKNEYEYFLRFQRYSVSLYHMYIIHTAPDQNTNLVKQFCVASLSADQEHDQRCAQRNYGCAHFCARIGWNL